MADDQQLPAPLTPPDCDLQSFPYMELDVGRLRQSKFSATPNAEAFRAGLLLWCASWHQIPAASLPDDDIELADLAGYGKRPFSVKFWRKVRQEALNGFVKCSDGRLYHAVIAEKARAAWSSRLEYFYEKLKDRVRKENKIREKDGLQAITVPPFDDWISAGRPDRIPAENGLKGNGEGEGKGKGEGLGNTNLSGGSSSPADAAEPPPPLLLELTDDGTDPPDIPPCDHQAVLALWAKLVPTNPQPSKWTPQRQGHLRARWRELFAEGKAKTREDALAWFAKYFRWIAQSKFLTGRAPGTKGRPPMEARLDWCLAPDNLAKIIEGEYHRQE